MTDHIPIRVIDASFVGVKVQSPKAADKIYVRAVKGFFDSFRKVSGFAFLAVFAIIPWLTYDGHQAVLLDFSAQRFHIFSMTLWPQDLTLFAWLFIVSAFALFFITAVMGRIWCGFVCPQTVFTFLFVWVEEKVEGSRNKRIHLDKKALSLQKLLKKTIKHSIWLLIATLTALTFVGYFYPMYQLVSEFFTFDITFWPLFYIVLFTLCTYGNAGWMREIMCTHICPYARFQSSMFDSDTLTVTYNTSRGEGRGPRPKKMSENQYKANGLGDCIDCNLCVQVCPTGIDIRNGLQYECINCGACVDACNGVMDKMNYAKGLISYTSENATQGKKSAVLRPKVVGYFVVFIIMMGLLTASIYTKPDMDIDVVRDRKSLFRDGVQGTIENSYTLILMNKSQQSQRFKIELAGLEHAEIIGDQRITVDAAELVNLPVTVSILPENLSEQITPFTFRISNRRNDVAEQESTFIYR